jgi:hypothetical protein
MQDLSQDASAVTVLFWGPVLTGWLAFMGIFTKLLVPETKGVPIEAIEDRFRAHWFWKRVMARTDAREERAAAAAAAGVGPTVEMAGDGHEPVCKVVKVGGGQPAVKHGGF